MNTVGFWLAMGDCDTKPSYFSSKYEALKYQKYYCGEYTPKNEDEDKVRYIVLDEDKITEEKYNKLIEDRNSCKERIINKINMEDILSLDHQERRKLASMIINSMDPKYS